MKQIAEFMAVVKIKLKFTRYRGLSFLTARV